MDNSVDYCLWLGTEKMWLNVLLNAYFLPLFLSNDGSIV